MVHSKKLVFPLVILLAVTLLLAFTSQTFAQPIFTYHGHQGPFNPYAYNNLVAHVMFVDSNILFEQGGIVKTFIFHSSSSGIANYISTDYNTGFCMLSISSDLRFISLMVGQIMYSFELVR